MHDSENDVSIISSIGTDAAVCLVISKLQQSSELNEVDECWTILKECLMPWLSQSTSTEQRKLCFEEIRRLKRFSNHKEGVCQLFGETAIENDSLEEANLYLSKVICRPGERHSPETFETVSNVRNTLLVRWGFRMLNDMRRNMSFRSAITAFISQFPTECTVLDLGAGTGILSIYAAQAGAAAVFAVEQDEVMFNICKQVVSKKDSVDVFHCSSDEFEIETKHVDLVVTETLDSVGIGEGIVIYCHDLASKSENDELVFIPSSISLKGFLIQSETLELSYFSGQFKSSIGTPEEPYCCEFINEFEDCVKLSDPVTIFHVKLGNSMEKNVFLLDIQVSSDGWCNGICSYFIADLYKGTSITSAPNFIETRHDRMDCWEQGYHPLPKKYVTTGQVTKIKVELSDIGVVLSWVGQDSPDYTLVEARQIKFLNSSFASCPSNELLNIIPRILDVGGLVISDPFKHVVVRSVSFHGYVVHSKKLITWSRVHPPALYLAKSKESETIATEMNKYRTLIHENVPWSTLEHTKLSDHTQFLKVSRTSTRNYHRFTEFTSLANLTPTALVFWTEIEFNSGLKISTCTEPLWRPAAIIFSNNTDVREKYELATFFRGASFSAFIQPA